jgi:hypothetical protein
VKKVKAQKTRLQILVDTEDLIYLHSFDRSGEKNASEVIHELIYDHKIMKESIDKFKKRVIEQATKKSYEEVRTEQIHGATKIYVEPATIDDKWAWLRGSPEDPNLKNKVDLKKSSLVDKEKVVRDLQKKKK